MYSAGKPSYWPSDLNKTSDIIDFFIVNGLSNNFVKVDDCSDLDSDHLPLYLDLSQTLI